VLVTLQIGVPVETTEQDLETLKQLSATWTSQDSRTKIRW